MRQQSKETQSKETRKEETRKTDWWSRWKSGLGANREKFLKKDQLIIGLLTGVLLIVIALPAERTLGDGQEGTDVSGVENSAPKETSKSPAEDKGSLAGAEDEGSTAGSVSDSYTREMEQRLSAALARVEGVGSVQVLITWKTSAEKVVEKDVPADSQTVEEADGSGGTRTTVQENREETTVYWEEDGSRSPYVIKEIVPQAEGVLVIAQGGDDPRTAQDILEAVQALFPLDAHKIKIMKMEGSK